MLILRVYMRLDREPQIINHVFNRFLKVIEMLLKFLVIRIHNTLHLLNTLLLILQQVNDISAAVILDIEGALVKGPRFYGRFHFRHIVLLGMPITAVFEY